jgi:Family of unknown function (DUF6499)
MNNKWRPDWRKAEEYPDPKDTSVKNERWAWEFLRRNEQYSADCSEASVICGSLADDKDKDEFLEDDGVLYPGVTYSLDGFGFTPEVSEPLCRKYMVQAMYPPSTPPDRVTFRYDYVPEYLCFDQLGKFFNIGQFYNNDPEMKSEDWSEVLFKFRLDLKLDEQLAWVKSKLEKMRQAFEKHQLIEVDPSGRISRKDRTNYQKHLRFLDGLSAGENRYQVGKVLYPGQNTNDLRERQAEAQALCKWKYKVLLYHAPSLFVRS